MSPRRLLKVRDIRRVITFVARCWSKSTRAPPEERSQRWRAPSAGLVIHLLRLSDHCSRVLVIPPCHALGISQLVGTSPFSEIDSDYGLRFKPYAAFHLLGRQALPPSTFRDLWQIREWTIWNLEVFDPREYIAASIGDESRPNTARKHQILTTIESHNKRIKAVRPWRVSANDKPLS